MEELGKSFSQIKSPTARAAELDLEIETAKKILRDLDAELQGKDDEMEKKLSAGNLWHNDPLYNDIDNLFHRAELTSELIKRLEAERDFLEPLTLKQ
jgi:hypothetical protein